MTINTQLVRAHIERLHNIAADVDGLFVLASYGEGKPIVRHFKIGDIEPMVKTAIALAEQGKNVYAPLVVMRPDLPPGHKGGEQDIVAILGYVVDFDKGAGRNWQERCPIEPSFVIETSPGNAQCFFMLQKASKLTEDSRKAKAKNYAKRLVNACDGADRVSMDLSHVWRVPGLPNYPNSKKVQAGRDPNPAQVYELKSFAGHYIGKKHLYSLPQIEAIKSAPATLSNTTVEYKKKFDIELLKENLEGKLYRTIKDGVPEGERSEAVSYVVWALLKRGYGTGDIVDAIYEYPIGERFNGDIDRIKKDVLRSASKKPVTNDNHSTNQDYYLSPVGIIVDKDIQPRPWVLGNFLIKGKVSLLVAAPGVGKSLFSLLCLLSVSMRLPISGLALRKTGRVAVINNEDDMDEMRRRIAGFCTYYKIDRKMLSHQMYIQSGQDYPFMIARRNENNSLVSHHKDALVKFIKEHGITVLVVDPFLETHEANENDNREINEVMRLYRDIAYEADCAICLVHHTRKEPGHSSDGQAGNMDSGRGASSLIGAARVMNTLCSMSQRDAIKYGVQANDMHRYIRLDDAKANFSLKSYQPIWFRKESVKLENGESVGVLVVADELKDATIHKENYAQQLLEFTKMHPAFLELRQNKKMSRESFIRAMQEAKVFLGEKITARATFQERTCSYLMGNGIVDMDGNKIWMVRKSDRYTIFASFIDAGMPNSELKYPADLTIAQVLS